MWRRCRPPEVDNLRFSVSAIDLVRFSGPVYALYIPDGDNVLIAGASLLMPEKPRGSSDADPYLRWSAVKKRFGQPRYWEWWSSPQQERYLPRLALRPGVFLRGKRKVKIAHSSFGPVVGYAEQPELLRRFWRSIIARLFRFVDPLALTEQECREVAGYSQMWVPLCWSYSGNDTYYPQPPRDFFESLVELARSCQGYQLPLPNENLISINNYINQLFARLSHRFGFLCLSTNHILTFALADKIAETHWSGSRGDVCLMPKDIDNALRYWLIHHLPRYTTHLPATPTDRLLHPYKLASNFGIQGKLNMSPVLREDQAFLLRDGYIDPNYIKVPSGTAFSVHNVFVPTFPLLAQNRRICAFLYSMLQNDEWYAHFPLSAEPLPTTVQIGGETYALSALVNLSIERLEKSFQ